MSKNNAAWLQLFDKYHILQRIEEDGFFHISAKQINEFREARLMTKFDQRSNLPPIFKSNNISILPVTRGSYVLGNFEAYHHLAFDKTVETISVPFPHHIESIDYTNIYSENAALNCAFLCGILDDFLGEAVLPTVSGRMSTGSFHINVRTHKNQDIKLAVNNSQCEIDGGFESANKLMLIEAKNFISDDFLIRQLYYPFRLWNQKMKKEVVPVFMIYSNDIFSFFRFKFEEEAHYNSLQLVEQKNYIIAPENIGLEEIRQILNRIIIINEPKVPFPQADKFERIIDLLGLFMEQEAHNLQRDSITENYNFDSRQTDYYANAGIYLGLIERTKPGEFQLTEQGEAIMKMASKKKWLALVESILSHEVFNLSLQEYFKSQSHLTVDQVIEIMKQCYVHNVNTAETRRRRAQTVLKWIDWILKLIDS